MGQELETDREQEKVGGVQVLRTSKVKLTVRISHPTKKRSLLCHGREVCNSLLRELRRVKVMSALEKSHRHGVLDREKGPKQTYNP